MTRIRLYLDTLAGKVAAGAALALCSYLTAGLVNASPVVQPAMSRWSPRNPVIVAAPQDPAPARALVSPEEPLRAL